MRRLLTPLVVSALFACETGVHVGLLCSEAVCSDACPTGLDADGDRVCFVEDCDDTPETGAACSSGCALFFVDTDHDGFGVAATSRLACVALPGYVAVPGDCADLQVADPGCGGLTGALCHPGSPDVCDGADNDCDSATADGADDARVGIACDGPDADTCLNDRVGCVGGQPLCVTVGGISVEQCNDQLDNDCDGAIDCADSECDGANCTCNNGVRDGDESDVDCGGPCSRCPDQRHCAAPADCASGSCYEQRCLTARVVPTAANIDYFLGRSCYGIWAFSPEAGETIEALAAQYRGCKHIRWVDFTWYGNQDFGGFTPTYFDMLARFTAAVHAQDPEVVIEAAFAEFTCVPLYDRTAYDFSLFPELTTHYGYSGAGVFSGAAVVRASTRGMWNIDCDPTQGQPPDVSNNGVTDTGSAETVRLYTWLAANYARAGFEAFYLPQNDLTSGLSSGVPAAQAAASIQAIVQRIREVGALYGRRGSVLVAGEVYDRSHYDAVLVDAQGYGVVDYLKAIPEVDWVRADGSGATSAKPTSAGSYAPSCVEDERMAWESRLGRRLATAQADVCFVDNDLGYRDGSRYSGTYGQESTARANAFWLAAQNPARIPTVLELDGCQPAADRGAAPWGDLIRNGIWPQVRFFATRPAATRQSFARYAVWAARSLFAREGVPVYSAAPIKVDQAGHGGCVGNAYPEEVYCPGSNKDSFFYQAQPGFCDDLPVVHNAIAWTPADVALALRTIDGRIVAIGGGYRTSLAHVPGELAPDTVVDIEIRPDQTGYDVLTAGGKLVSYVGSNRSELTAFGGACDLETYGGERLLLFVDGGACAVASSADGFASRTRRTGCTSPVRLASKPGTLAILDGTGRIWAGPDAATLTASDVLRTDPAAALGVGDRWVDIEYRPQDGELIAASSYGTVVRVHADLSVVLVQGAQWSFAVAADIEYMSTATGAYLYLLDTWGGLHEVPIATDGPSATSFPDLYPWPYYSGAFQGRYLGMQAVPLR